VIQVRMANDETSTGMSKEKSCHHARPFVAQGQKEAFTNWINEKTWCAVILSKRVVSPSSNCCRVPIPEPGKNALGFRTLSRCNVCKVYASPASRAMTPSFQEVSHGLNKYLSHITPMRTTVRRTRREKGTRRTRTGWSRKALHRYPRQPSRRWA